MIGVVLWTVMTVRRSGALTGGGGGDGGEGGARETVGAAGRDPIRRDEKRVEREAFERMTGEVRRGLVAPK